LRQCHADETTTLLARIDPAIFTSSDREAIMQPMILGMLEKQLKTDYLSSTMSTACPVGNREADEILQTLHKPWLEDKNNRTEEMVKDLKVCMSQKRFILVELCELTWHFVRIQLTPPTKI
jgi:hypothetical protein